MYSTTSFIHIPVLERVNPLDLRTRNHPQNSQTGSNLGGGQSAKRAHLPAMTMW